MDKLLKEISEKKLLLGEFGKEVEEYCRQHSSNGDGHFAEFSRVPWDCSCEIAIDVISMVVEYLKVQEQKPYQQHSLKNVYW